MNDLLITVTGWVATDPRLYVGPQGVRLTSFRLATTSRYFDRTAGAWTDGQTEWFTVRLFRAAAVLVLESIKKGQPVVVHGRLRTNEWTADSGPRTDLVIDAQALGHDLTRGIAKFERAIADGTEAPAATAAVEGDDTSAEAPGEADGEPLDEARDVFDADDSELIDPDDDGALADADANAVGAGSN